ncbi:MAG TPA: zf-HC2 domain-containing protein, partial [Polyangia bacterium]|nr:zf-HC2 domain-containing protein [Polyangia bacterium]
MDCKRVDEELVAFHLSALDGPTRAAVEAHLCGCGRCVGAYLMLKRAVDAGEDAPAPSETLRARVMRAAASELAPAVATRAPRRRWMAWSATAAAAALLVAAPFVYRAGVQKGASSVEIAAPMTPALQVVPVSTRSRVDSPDSIDTA